MQDIQVLIQLASSVPGRFAFYDMISGNFDHLQMPLKVLKTSFSLLILINIDQIFQKKITFGPVGQEAAKIKTLKLCASRESNPGRSESNDSLHKVAFKM